MTVHKPPQLIGHDEEWRLLHRTVTTGSGLSLVTGRRGTGKSTLLRALAHATNGLFHACVQGESDIQARRRFAAAIANHVDVHPFHHNVSWETLLRTALSPPKPLFIDNHHYATRASPGLIDALRSLNTGHVVLCGREMSGMADNLALRLCLSPLDYRRAATHWRIADPAIAWRVHACVGGLPVYRDLLPRAPTVTAGFEEWLRDGLLCSDHPMYAPREAGHLLDEDSNVAGHAMCHRVLAAFSRASIDIRTIAGSPSRAARQAERLLRVGGYLYDVPNVLEGSPTTKIADPVIRFDQVITASHRRQLESWDAGQVWRAMVPRFETEILRQDFEATTRQWLRLYARDELDRPEGFGDIGSGSVHNSHDGTFHEINVLSRQNDRVTFLGESKAASRQRRMADLQRLEHIKGVLTEKGYDTANVVFGLFAQYGFSAELEATARQRSDVELVDLDRLYWR